MDPLTGLIHATDTRLVFEKVPPKGDGFLSAAGQTLGSSHVNPIFQG